MGRWLRPIYRKEGNRNIFGAAFRKMFVRRTLVNYHGTAHCLTLLRIVRFSSNVNHKTYPITHPPINCGLQTRISIYNTYGINWYQKFTADIAEFTWFTSEQWRYKLKIRFKRDVHRVYRTHTSSIFNKLYSYLYPTKILQSYCNSWSLFLRHERRQKVVEINHKSIGNDTVNN